MVSMFFGQYLLEQGAIDREALLDALSRQRRANRTLIDLALSQGLLSQAQSDEVMFLFRSTDRSLEQILVEGAYLDRDQVSGVLEAQHAGWLRIGDALVEGGHLTREQVAAHLEVFRRCQREAEYRLEHSFAGVEDAETVKTFFSLASSYVGRLLGRAVKLVAVEGTEGGLGADRRRYAQHFTGDRDLYFAIDVDDRLGAQLAASLLGAGREVGPEAARDAVCEVVNVVGGNACTRVEALGHRLRPEPPTVSGPRPPISPDGFSTRAVLLVEEEELVLRVFPGPTRRVGEGG